MLFSIFLLFGVVVAQSSQIGDQEYWCRNAIPAPGLPQCTRRCLDGKFFDATCAVTLGGFCQLEGIIDDFFDSFGICILARCSENKDRYDFMSAFKKDCEGKSYGPIKKSDVGQDWARYLDAVPTSSGKPSSKAVSSTQSTFATSGSTAPAPSSAVIATVSPPTSVSTVTEGREQPQTTKAGPLPRQSQPDVQPITSVVTETEANGVTHIHTIETTPAVVPTSSPSAKHAEPQKNTATIAGAAAGGAVFLAASIAAIFFLLRRRKRSRAHASTPPSWDPSAGGHAKATLPDLESHSAVGSGAQMANDKGELHNESTIPDRYATMTNPHAQNRNRNSGVPPVPLKYHHTQTQHSDMQQQHANIQHQPQILQPEMRFTNSPYPELESRSLPPISPSTTLHTMSSWHSPSPPAHGVGSPVSELGATTPIVRLNGGDIGDHGGAVELGNGGGGYGVVDMVWRS
ncbi:hypothetical protein CC86DRAFT_410700 [Ophiobolus disseminans]|uniref:Extracellular membrane protein CFEM domain-containing protein n=1 Tax=Ophiobolus disseminans TaxID=1469910 RepID=A0A6A6ZLR6_9PLEO|nr:hypothetical protein CC86DRAFT_410700 [Ophiobolus disseminans]